MRSRVLNCAAATVPSYAELDGDDFLVIGGYESGVDAAYHLADNGKKVIVTVQTRGARAAQTPASPSQPSPLNEHAMHVSPNTSRCTPTMALSV